MINRRYKDTVFRDLFGAPERRHNALDLYNALSGSHYTDPSVLELTTIDDVIYMGVKNDISFIINDEMMLWEHQSTFSPNMALRGLWYFSKLYTRWVDAQDRSVYGSTRILLPTPRFFVFYAGEQERPDQELLRLSDAFIGGPGDVEVCACVLNVNEGHNPELAASCTALAGYAHLVAQARKNRSQGGMAADVAVEAAVEACIRDGVLTEYLSDKRAEVSEMFMTEYDEEKTMRQLQAESLELGLAKGRAEGRSEGLVKGRSEGIVASLRALISSTGADEARAMELLAIPVEEQPFYSDLLAQS